MAEAPPLEGGALPESREASGEAEAMEVESSLLAHSLLSREVEGEVHSTDELFHEAVLQTLFSINAVVAGGDEQARREALTLQPSVPLEDVAR